MHFAVQNLVFLSRELRLKIQRGIRALWAVLFLAPMDSEEDDPFDYLAAICPLIAPALLITPLDVVTLRCKVPPWAQPLRKLSVDLDPVFLRNNFVYLGSDFADGRYHTIITHMFLHRDYDHLLANVVGLLLSGWSVYREFGSGALYGTYFGGGIVATLYNEGRLIQLSRAMSGRVSKVVKGVPEKLTDLDVPYEMVEKAHEASKWIERTAEKMATLVAPYILPSIGFMGCSAGVSAVMGINLCLSLERLFRGLFRKGKKRKGEGRRRLINLACDITTVNMKLKPWRYEYDMYRKGSWDTDHAGHLSGLATGVACYAMFRLGGYYWRPFKRWMNSDDDSRGRP